MQSWKYELSPSNKITCRHSRYYASTLTANLKEKSDVFLLSMDAIGRECCIYHNALISFYLNIPPSGSTFKDCKETLLCI